MVPHIKRSPSRVDLLLPPPSASGRGVAESQAKPGGPAIMRGGVELCRLGTILCACETSLGSHRRYMHKSLEKAHSCPHRLFPPLIYAPPHFTSNVMPPSSAWRLSSCKVDLLPQLNCPQVAGEGDDRPGAQQRQVGAREVEVEEDQRVSGAVTASACFSHHAAENP